MDEQTQAPVEEVTNDPQTPLNEDPQDEVSRLTAKLEEMTSALQRERADFQNFKKRIDRDQGEQRSKIGAEVLKKFLPIVDDFERAMGSIPADQSGDWLTGMTMILRKFHSLLESENVEMLNPLGEPFDPNYHEVIGMEPATETYPSQSVSAVLQKGYRQGERVLRPAMVRVAE